MNRMPDKITGIGIEFRTINNKEIVLDEVAWSYLNKL